MSLHSPQDNSKSRGAAAPQTRSCYLAISQHKHCYTLFRGKTPTIRRENQIAIADLHIVCLEHTHISLVYLCIAHIDSVIDFLSGLYEFEHFPSEMWVINNFYSD